ncbi:tetratricopeptide repeat protein [Luteolibacter sp. AS25]|uniref:tetratricopeptide repeat protein n=1 Tax=Luteolibacter sp. AS25 TaxID=3135776 RepID=UPI00398B9948
MKFVCTFYLLFSALVWSENAESLLASATRAIDSGLWDVATLQLQSATRSETLSEQEQAAALLLLSESLIRGNRPDEALSILDDSLVSGKPDSAFWRGQALAGKGRYSEAVETLLPIAQDPENPLQVEAALTAASLKLSLSQAEESLAILDLLEDPEGPVKLIRARLTRVEILIDLGRIELARSIFPVSNNIPEKFSPLAKFLNAAILLEEGKPEAAEPLFKELIADPKGQSMQRYNQAALGYADAMAAQGRTERATSSLLSFIQENPESPLLAPMFVRIINWLPDSIISEENQTLEQLDEWIPQSSPVSSGLINTSPMDAAASMPSAPTELTDLEVFSLYANARGLRRVATDRAKLRAYSLLQRIRILAPRHFLTPRSLLELGKWQLEDNKAELAFSTFISLREFTTSPVVKGEASFLGAGIAFENRDFTLASELYSDAAELLSGENSHNAALNAALTKLEKDPTATIFITTENPKEDAAIKTDLELEKALVTSDPTKARSALDTFLNKNPEHPRAAEARLAIAKAALAISPPDVSTARAQLDTISASGKETDLASDQDFALTKLRMLDLLDDTKATTDSAKKLISDFPATHTASEASLILGKTLFKTGNYNDARLILEKLATAEAGTQRGQAALLLAARSAALGATEQSREEALVLFDKTIETDGPLTALAKLEKARLNISLNRLEVAIESLTEAYRSISPENPVRLPTGLLLAEAIYAQGDSNPENLGKTLKIYDELLESTPENSSRNFRIQYLRGLTLERLPAPESPAKTRVNEALATYFSVLDRPADPPPAEWEWFYKSGFRALLILEDQERWQAAISLAEKIASFGGPRTEDAATRARQLRLKHMVWEE